MISETPFAETELGSIRRRRPGIDRRFPIEQPDRDLMRRVADGDDGAFTSVYQRHAPLLFSVIFHILHDRKEAEDILQETFVQIWKKAANYSAERGSIATWSVMIARHKAIDKLRSRCRYSLATRAAAIENLFDSGKYADAETDRQTLDRDERDRVRNAIKEIGDLQREAILLAFFSGLTHVQIAQRLHAPLGTVKARIRRGLFALRQALGPIGSREHQQALVQHA